MKKKLLSAVLLSSVLLGAGACAAKETEKTDKEVAGETTVVEETTEVTTEATTETTTEATEETTEETTEPDIADSVLGEDYSTDQFEAYKECATKLHEINDKYRFCFGSDYLDDDLGVQNILSAFDTETGVETKFFADKGVLTKVDSFKYDEEWLERLTEEHLSYENLMRLPLMTGVTFGDDAYVDELPDGHYLGYLIAVNAEDHSKVIVLLGESVGMTEEEYNSLKPGDKIQVEFGDITKNSVTVESVDESVTGPGRVTLSEFDESGSSNSFYLEQGSKYAPNEKDYIFIASNDVPVTKDYKFVEMTVSPDCKIEDSYYANMALYEGYEDDLKQYIDENGLTDPISTSAVYFHDIEFMDPGSEKTGEWLKVSANMWPCKIENGQLTYINFELR